MKSCLQKSTQIFGNDFDFIRDTMIGAENIAGKFDKELRKCEYLRNYVFKIDVTHING